MDIRIKRVYETVDAHDGFRVLVDRLWPRGRTKDQVRTDLWLKEVAPSTALRKWFNHDQSRWEIFKSRYSAELDDKPEIVKILLEKAAKERLTLLFAAHDVEYNQAVVLKDYLLSASKQHGTKDKKQPS
ncbi:DUF488 family protein [Desulfopila sp. IMCC35006]|uniref:DUF488 domain-containing protein n=1 Tax=Desulfopila sp. IMCC35006 TaxID=2569542 RepID=UPI0010AC4DD0|nr:DUF488 family protein [Desulfopila sp. IMCC35006]TKB24645.1 DUF488 family protein [Desulfopila sp. IMCC35006]